SISRRVSSRSMAGSHPGVAARHLGPARARHHLRPAPIKLAMVALAHAEIAGPSVELLVKPLVAKPHLRVERSAARHDTATGARAFLPIVHVVLLKGAGRAEAPHPGEPDRLLDMRRGGLVGVDPRPDLGLVGPARLPDAEGARGGAQHREIWEHRA